MTGYDLYYQWCQDHNRKPPTKEWWEAACANQDFRNKINTPFLETIKDQEEIDRERREGWGYDY